MSAKLISQNSSVVWVHVAIISVPNAWINSFKFWLFLGLIFERKFFFDFFYKYISFFVNMEYAMGAKNVKTLYSSYKSELKVFIQAFPEFS